MNTVQFQINGRFNAVKLTSEQRNVSSEISFRKAPSTKGQFTGGRVRAGGGGYFGSNDVAAAKVSGIKCHIHKRGGGLRVG